MHSGVAAAGGSGGGIGGATPTSDVTSIQRFYRLQEYQTAMMRAHLALGKAEESRAKGVGGSKGSSSSAEGEAAAAVAAAVAAQPSGTDAADLGEEALEEALKQEDEECA